MRPVPPLIEVGVSSHKVDENEVRKISDAFKEMVKLTFDDFTLSSYGDENVFTLEKIVDYCALKNILIPVEAKVENYLAVRFSGKTFFFLADYAELFEETDYVCRYSVSGGDRRVLGLPCMAG